MLKTDPNVMAPFGAAGGLGGLLRDMDRLFEMTSLPVFGSAGPSARPAWPGLNVWRDDDALVAEAEIPGYGMDDVEVLATEDTVTIRGRRSRSAPEEATPLRVERTVSSFERSLRMPVPVDPDGVQAMLENGVLRVTLPIAESARPRRVQVRALGSGPERGALPAASSGEPGDASETPAATSES